MIPTAHVYVDCVCISVRHLDAEITTDTCGRHTRAANQGPRSFTITHGEGPYSCFRRTRGLSLLSNLPISMIVKLHTLRRFVSISRGHAPRAPPEVVPLTAFSPPPPHNLHHPHRAWYNQNRGGCVGACTAEVIIQIQVSTKVKIIVFSEC